MWIAIIVLLQMFKLGEKMSSPTKQVSVRRLPPLPNQITLRNFRENGNVNDETHAGGGIGLKGKPSGGENNLTRNVF